MDAPDPPDPAAEAVVAFWRDAGPKRWFKKDAAFDAELRERFADLHARAATGALERWAGAAQGALARLLVLDQFARNLHRDSALAFATDGLARAAARDAVARGFDAQIEPALRPFVYMPLTHSEALADQLRGVELVRRRLPNDADTLRYAELHLAVVRRFGRFPHRNRVLGRTTTPAEQAFLDGGGFKG